MARNILKKVVSFYQENPHNFSHILIDSIKQNSILCKHSLECGNIDDFAKCLNNYWNDKKLLDTGSTNSRIEDIISKIKPFVSGVTLCGAGGGGFMYILAKSKKMAKKIKEELSNDTIIKYSKFYDFSISDTGLTLTIQ